MIGLSAMVLTGCGTYVPQIQELWDTEQSADLNAGGVLEYKIKQQVYCGIVDAVISSRRAGLLPSGWAVQVTLDLQVDEAGSVNPGATFVGNPTFSFGVGGTLSSQGTREDKFGTYWYLDKLTSFKGTPCKEGASEKGSSLLLYADLGIAEWLKNSLTIDYYTPASEVPKETDAAFKQEYLSYHVKFVVISSGNVNPVWKLARVTTGNGNLPLAGAGRTRTHDLLITFGPAYKAGTPNLPIASHAAQEFGISTSNGNRTLVAPFVGP